jgi:hypothetical protein
MNIMVFLHEGQVDTCGGGYPSDIRETDAFEDFEWAEDLLVLGAAVEKAKEDVLAAYNPTAAITNINDAIVA